ncbi:hypothetical protein I0C86_26855 [Plantactinospora sp. S1510]|uniref:Uncharacterized protein n=1 Tax=Plantactinospora alkalitolerans TaxID=2789879 RepID=A0ABS0H281_9ACTN|nr:hypothetical protein [Plantactinospora alkalitolerans]MBF9132544.1 hypothetical protein [Plantactinospora alkalitolerans]
MAHDAEHGCAEGEPSRLLGDHEPLPPLGPASRLRWVCGASAGLPAGPVEGISGRTDVDPGDPGDRTGPARPMEAVDCSGSVRPGDPAERVDLDRELDPGDQRDGTPAVELVARSGRGAGSDGADRGAGRAEPGLGGERSRLIPRPRPGESRYRSAPEPDHRADPDPDDPGAFESGGHGASDPGGRDTSEPGRLGAPERVGGTTGSAEESGGPSDDEVDDVDCGRTPGCRTDRPGWAGAHRHGAVRPSRRAVRRDRPPRRWC